MWLNVTYTGSIASAYKIKRETWTVKQRFFHYKTDEFVCIRHFLPPERDNQLVIRMHTMLPELEPWNTVLLFTIVANFQWRLLHVLFVCTVRATARLWLVPLPFTQTRTHANTGLLIYIDCLNYVYCVTKHLLTEFVINILTFTYMCIDIRPCSILASGDAMVSIVTFSRLFVLCVSQL